MKEAIAAGLLMVALLFLPPLLLTPRTEGQHRPEQTVPEETPQEDAEKSAAPRSDEATVLRVAQGDQIVEMTMAEYLPGVVRGEMPAVFEMAALEAQAVAERTYVCYHMRGGGKSNHPDADVCTDPACCSAWLSEEDARGRWGENYETYNARIRQAVANTDGQILLYDGQPILAAFHSSSAGSTADSGDVWVNDLPYLQSVATPENADTVPNYYSVLTKSAEEFRQAVLAAAPEAKLEGDAAGWITDVTTDGSGRVEKLSVGGVPLTGAQLRSMLGLRSTAFTVSAEGDSVTFRVTGYGHGVGMSQYGANELAKQGKTWQEIVAWYYTGVTIGPAA